MGDNDLTTDLETPTGCIKKNKTLLFSPNFQPKSLGNGWSDLLKNHCAKSPHCGLFAQEISSDSDKWFPSYCGWKLGEKKSVLFFLIHPVSSQENKKSGDRENMSESLDSGFLRKNEKQTKM